MFPLEIAGMRSSEACKRVRVTLKNLGLEHKIHSKPLRLSGGEQQRVAIARAIINDPLVLLADEPTGNLDLENTQIVMNILNEVNARGTTVVVATHDMNLIEKYPRRVIHLEKGRVTNS
jgi:cell division transport system ATP-binding protein